MGSPERLSRLSALSARRWLVPRVSGTAYVAAAALRAEGGTGLRAWGLGALALVVSVVSTRRGRRASSLALWGASIVLASLGTSVERPLIDAAGISGGLLAGMAACVALQAMGDAATATPLWVPPRDRSPVVAAAVLALAGAIAILSLVSAAVGLELGRFLRDAPLGTGVVSGVVLTVACDRTLASRRLVLGVADRARIARASCVVTFLFAATLAWIGMGSLERALRLAVAVASVVIAHVALHGEPIALARAWRRVTVLFVFGSPVVVLAAIAAEGSGGQRAVVALVIAAVAVGSAASHLEKPLRPSEGAWLDGVVAARRAMGQAEPDTALREALAALRAPAGPTAASPELWTFDPPRVRTIDAAGYSRERAGELPGAMVPAAAREPEATLRVELLEALEVRRPDLRPLLQWMTDHGALSASVITVAGEAKGVLVLPRGRLSGAMSLEEIREIKSLADSLAGPCEGRSALLRSMDREREAAVRADLAEERALRLEQARSLDASRNMLATSRAARHAVAGFYSATSRLALEALERRMKADAPVAVIAPSGVDPVPYLARAQLSGPRRNAPLVIVDGTSSRDHDLARWNDPLASPLALADKGLLVLLDGAALPADVQRLIAHTLAERRPPWGRAEPLDILLAFTAVRPVAELVLAGGLHPALATRLGDAADAPVALPRLAERSEDLRAVFTDRLAREGLRMRGSPVGIEDAAFAQLAEYAFPGEDAELAVVARRLVAAVGHERGDVVRARDVEALRLQGPAGELPAVNRPRSVGRDEARGMKRG